jgi:hypothetical protein
MLRAVVGKNSSQWIEPRVTKDGLPGVSTLSFPNSVWEREFWGSNLIYDPKDGLPGVLDVIKLARG